MIFPTYVLTSVIENINDTTHNEQSYCNIPNPCLPHSSGMLLYPFTCCLTHFAYLDGSFVLVLHSHPQHSLQRIDCWFVFSHQSDKYQQHHRWQFSNLQYCLLWSITIILLCPIKMSSSSFVSSPLVGIGWMGQPQHQSCSQIQTPKESFFKIGNVLILTEANGNGVYHL